MFCPECGKETKNLGRCLDCFLAKNPITLKKVSIPTCGCGSFFYKARWCKPGELGKTLGKILKGNLDHSREIKISSVTVSPELHGKKITGSMDITGEYNGEVFVKTMPLEVNVEKRVCTTCSRLTGSYYEAVIQFRGVGSKWIEKLDTKYVSRIAEVPGGLDAYITSMNYAQKYAKDLSQRGFFTKTSSKVVGMRDGVDMCRIFISIKPPTYKPGDFLLYNKRVIHILSLGKSTQIYDLDRDKKSMAPPSKLLDCEVIASAGDLHKAVVSALTPDVVQLIDLETYGNIEVPLKGTGLRERLNEKDEVGYIRIRGKTYILKGNKR